MALAPQLHALMRPPGATWLPGTGVACACRCAVDAPAPVEYGSLRTAIMGGTNLRHLFVCIQKGVAFEWACCGTHAPGSPRLLL